MLFSGTGITGDRDPLLAAAVDRLDGTGQRFAYRELDPDVYGENLNAPAERIALAETMSARTHVKPGITGLWQINGRSDLSWEQSVQFDLTYVAAWSAALDVRILLRTPAAIIRGSGAY
ncbi:sugar transferase [Dactylosporangium sp. McL0621]|uniref:sugar transferase n=1 Tax=Dactylosporangium sp. McL0621 TaxID=3415678 RepID=UPI003CEDE43E